MSHPKDLYASGDPHLAERTRWDADDEIRIALSTWFGGPDVPVIAGTPDRVIAWAAKVIEIALEAKAAQE